MAKISIWNIGKANAELNATADVLAPALAKAGIQTIAVDGKTVPAADAPISLQVAALLTAQPTVDGAQNAAEALVSNELISAELTKTKTELAVAQTGVEGLTRDKAALTEKLTTAEAAVQDLTTKNSVLTTERDACSSQFATASKALTSAKVEVARACLNCGCVDFKAADGSKLTAEATDEQLALSAKDMTHGQLVTAYSGALNAAASKVGISLASLPATGSQINQVKSKSRAEFLALQPNEQSAFLNSGGKIAS